MTNLRTALLYIPMLVGTLAVIALFIVAVPFAFLWGNWHLCKGFVEGIETFKRPNS